MLYVIIASMTFSMVVQHMLMGAQHMLLVAQHMLRDVQHMCNSVRLKLSQLPTKLKVELKLKLSVAKFVYERVGIQVRERKKSPL